jgi:PleD family two-component response regulator
MKAPSLLRRPPVSLVAWTTSSHSPPVSGTYPLVAERKAILVVDSNASSRGAIADALSARYRVYEATDGMSALAAAKRVSPALVITEIVLADVIDGLGVIKMIRAQSATLGRVPFVVVSSRSDSREIARAVAAGARRYLVKPCIPENLEDIVSRIVA